MDARLLFPSKYLKAADLRGKDVHLTISRVVGHEEMKTDQGKKKRPMIYFEEVTNAYRRGVYEDDKRLVLNVTNMHTIAKICGTYEITHWVGHRITLFATTCQRGREIVDCIRIRETAPPPKRQNGSQRKPEPKPQPELEPPADDSDDFDPAEFQDEPGPGELSEAEEKALEEAGVFGE